MAFPSHGSALKLKNVLLFLASIVVSILVAEAAVRYIDGYPMFAMPLGNPEGSATVDPAMLDKFPLAAGVDRKWFFSEPPPLPNRRKVDPEWQRLFHYIEQHNVGGMDFRPADVFKAWNSAFAGDPCKHKFLRHAPGMLYLYDPPDGEAAAALPLPARRHAAHRAGDQPDGLARCARSRCRAGPRPSASSSSAPRPPSAPPHLPFSYPELVGYWLNRWAESKKLAVHFEVLNAARESIVSTDNVAIVKNEVAPLRPDLVVYYEGGNQFELHSIVDKVPPRVGRAQGAAGSTAVPGWLQAASRYSAIAARVRAAIGMAGSSQDGREWPKPDYRAAVAGGAGRSRSRPLLPQAAGQPEPDPARPRRRCAPPSSKSAATSR